MDSIAYFCGLLSLGNFGALLLKKDLLPLASLLS